MIFFFLVVLSWCCFMVIIWLFINVMKNLVFFFLVIGIFLVVVVRVWRCLLNVFCVNLRKSFLFVWKNFVLNGSDSIWVLVVVCFLFIFWWCVWRIVSLRLFVLVMKDNIGDWWRWMFILCMLWLYFICRVGLVIICGNVGVLVNNVDDVSCFMFWIIWMV